MKIFLSLLACLALCGCVVVSGTRTAPDGTVTQMHTSRFLWASEGIDFSLATATNGTLTTGLKVAKSNPDAAALEAVSRGAAEGTARGLKP